jgi:transcriptional regulator with XRE-family HTH domain
MTPQEYLKAIRATGMTQAEVAEKTGITQSQISKLERGDVDDVLSKNYLALQALYDELNLWDGITERRANPPCSGPKSNGRSGK